MKMIRQFGNIFKEVENITYQSDVPQRRERQKNPVKEAYGPQATISVKQLGNIQKYKIKTPIVIESIIVYIPFYLITYI